MTFRPVTRFTVALIRGLALLVLLGAAWRPALADLPAAYGTFSTFPASASFACGSLSVTGAPLPTLTATGSDCNDVLQAILIYAVRINGPDGGQVPVSVSSTHVLNATGAAQAGDSLSVAGRDIDVSNCYYASLAACGSHTSTTAFSLNANQVYFVAMMTIVSNFLGPGSASAFLDPQFSFDAGFADAASYAFEFSAGIGNGVPVGVTPVPEPEVVSMMLLGLAGLAAWRRRRRRVNPAVATSSSRHATSPQAGSLS